MRIRIILAAGGVTAVVAAVIAIQVQRHLKQQGSARVTNDCLSVMRLLDGAVEQYRVEHPGTSNKVVTFEDLRELLPGKISFGWIPGGPCPGGGTFSFGVPGKDPSCSIHGKL